MLRSKALFERASLLAIVAGAALAGSAQAQEGAVEEIIVTVQ